MKKMAALLYLCALTVLMPACASRMTEESNGQSAVLNENDLWKKLNGFSAITAAAVLSGKTENACFSPVSLYCALALAAEGTGSQTRSELTGLLGADKMLTEYAEALHGYLNKTNENGTIKLVNSIWLSNGCDFKKSYVNKAQKKHHASLYTVDFNNASTGESISSWIFENTGGKLKPEIKTDSDWLAAIINTLYFKSEWMTQFDENLTAPDIFHTSGGDVLRDFMEVSAIGSFYYGDGFSSASLQLKTGYMTFVLPDEDVSIDELLGRPGFFEDLLTDDGTYAINTKQGLIQYKIPKFSFSSGFELIDILKNLGVEAAFNPALADFSNMTESQACINKIIQETYVGVDENGVEATTYTLIQVFGAVMMPGDKFFFALDRPFVFIINDNAPLFIGVVYDPEQN